MEGLVNYSSEDEQDDYPYSKVALRERVSGVSAGSGRTTLEVSGSLKRSRSGSCERETHYRKGRESGSERLKIGNSNYEDKYKIDRKVESSRDHREKRDRESRNNRDGRDEREYDYNQKYDYKKPDDHKRYREQKRDHKRDDNDYHRDDKRYNRYDERKTSYVTNNKERFSTSKSRHDDRKQYDDRSYDERRATNEDKRGGIYGDDRRKDFNERRNYNNGDDRKADRRADDRRTQRSYNEDRSNTYRTRRSNSPSPSHHSKSNNKYNDRKEDSNVRRDHKRHSRSRSRSPPQSADSSIGPIIASTKVLNQRTVSGEYIGEIKNQDVEPQISERKNLPTARNFEALLTLPLSENASKNPNVVKVPATSVAPGSNTTTTTATVQLPSYYNPNVINPNKYVEQMQKRKLIWGAKKVEDSASKWGHAQFSQDQDGKVASKFMRLMGIKHATGNGGESSSTPNESEKKSSSSNAPQTNTDVKSREAMFSTMEHQYEVARQVTHTMRGVGLGFSSQSKPY